MYALTFSEIPTQEVKVLNVAPRRMSSRGPLAASLYRLAHLTHSTTLSRASISTASKKDIQKFAAELHEATKEEQEESEEDTKGEVAEKVVSIHNVSVAVDKQDKDPILEKKDRPPLRRRISISMQKTFTRQKTMKESDAPPPVSMQKKFTRQMSRQMTMRETDGPPPVQSAPAQMKGSVEELSPVNDVSPDPQSDTPE